MSSEGPAQRHHVVPQAQNPTVAFDRYVALFFAAIVAGSVHPLDSIKAPNRPDEWDLMTVLRTLVGRKEHSLQRWLCHADALHARTYGLCCIPRHLLVFPSATDTPYTISAKGRLLAAVAATELQRTTIPVCRMATGEATASDGIVCLTLASSDPQLETCYSGWFRYQRFWGGNARPADPTDAAAIAAALRRSQAVDTTDIVAFVDDVSVVLPASLCCAQQSLRPRAGAASAVPGGNGIESDVRGDAIRDEAFDFRSVFSRCMLYSHEWGPAPTTIRTAQNTVSLKLQQHPALWLEKGLPALMKKVMLHTRRFFGLPEKPVLAAPASARDPNAAAEHEEPLWIFSSVASWTTWIVEHYIREWCLPGSSIVLMRVGPAVKAPPSAAATVSPLSGFGFSPLWHAITFAAAKMGVSVVVVELPTSAVTTAGIAAAKNILEDAVMNAASALWKKKVERSLDAAVQAAAGPSNTSGDVDGGPLSAAAGYGITASLLRANGSLGANVTAPTTAGNSLTMTALRPTWASLKVSMWCCQWVSELGLRLPLAYLAAACNINHNMVLDGTYAVGNQPVPIPPRAAAGNNATSAGGLFSVYVAQLHGFIQAPRGVGIVIDCRATQAKSREAGKATLPSMTTGLSASALRGVPCTPVARLPPFGLIYPPNVTSDASGAPPTGRDAGGIPSRTAYTAEDARLEMECADAMKYAGLLSAMQWLSPLDRERARQGSEQLCNHAIQLLSAAWGVSPRWQHTGGVLMVMPVPFVSPMSSLAKKLTKNAFGEVDEGRVLTVSIPPAVLQQRLIRQDVWVGTTWLPVNLPPGTVSSDKTMGSNTAVIFCIGIYNTVGDIERLAAAVLDACGKGSKTGKSGPGEGLESLLYKGGKKKAGGAPRGKRAEEQGDDSDDEEPGDTTRRFQQRMDSTVQPSTRTASVAPSDGKSPQKARAKSVLVKASERVTVPSTFPTRLTALVCRYDPAGLDRIPLYLSLYGGGGGDAARGAPGATTTPEQQRFLETLIVRWGLEPRSSDLATRIERLLYTYDKKQVPKVGTMLEAYRGRQLELLSLLVTRFGPEPPSVEQAPTDYVLPPDAQSVTSLAKSSVASNERAPGDIERLVGRYVSMCCPERKMEIPLLAAILRPWGYPEAERLLKQEMAQGRAVSGAAMPVDPNSVLHELQSNHIVDPVPGGAEDGTKRSTGPAAVLPRDYLDELVHGLEKEKYDRVREAAARGETLEAENTEELTGLRAAMGKERTTSAPTKTLAPSDEERLAMLDEADRWSEKPYVSPERFRPERPFPAPMQYHCRYQQLPTYALCQRFGVVTQPKDMKKLQESYRLLHGIRLPHDEAKEAESTAAAPAPARSAFLGRLFGEDAEEATISTDAAQASSELEKVERRLHTDGTGGASRKEGLTRWDQAALIQRVKRFYQVYCPSKVSQAEALVLQTWKGKEHLLIPALVDKYGQEPAASAQQQHHQLEHGLGNIGHTPAPSSNLGGAKFGPAQTIRSFYAAMRESIDDAWEPWWAPSDPDALHPAH